MIDNTRAGYDLVAEEYSAEFSGELSQKPFDRKMLDWLMEQVGGRGPICDLGCGPGQIAAYLHAHGAQVSGIDLSETMVRLAKALHPAISFQQGNMPAVYAGRVHSFAIRGSSRPRSSRVVREALAAGQVAFTIVLLAASISVDRALIHLLQIDRGFDSAGALAGIAAAVISGHLLESLVEGAKSVDAAAYAVVFLLLAAIAATGIWVASRPIARLDIADILRSE